MADDDRYKDDGLAPLIDRARQGDAEARNELSARATALVSRFMSLNMSPRDRRWAESCDLTQVVVIEVLSRLDRLPGGAGRRELEQHLLRTARSRLIDHHRRNRREAGASVLGDAHDPPAPRSEQGPVTRTDELRWLERILSELPEKYAAVVRAHALEGLSFVEVGKKLGLPPDTVRRRYDRIRDRVAERIARLRDE